MYGAALTGVNFEFKHRFFPPKNIGLHFHNHERLGLCV